MVSGALGIFSRFLGGSYGALVKSQEVEERFRGLKADFRQFHNPHGTTIRIPPSSVQLRLKHP